ncbi:hypothetical protein KC19_1G172600 [Ceratodon purpureus]|uniref:Uncharacterized protein n=1 Tax=Ceratodon purpureus TaxID=3225 RepID=A0A8T0J6Y7_CERPU|nr:hypothetical protein KC19_1G172600 [Ceratodon purpureus]
MTSVALIFSSVLLAKIVLLVCARLSGFVHCTKSENARLRSVSVDLTIIQRW